MSFDFQYSAKADLRVFVTEPGAGPTIADELSQSAFTDTPGMTLQNGQFDGGSITLASAVSNKDVYVVRDWLKQRSLGYGNNAVSQTAIVAQLDALTGMAQDLDAKVARAPLAPPGAPEMWFDLDGKAGFALVVAGDEASFTLGSEIAETTVSAAMVPVVTGSLENARDTLGIAPIYVTTDAYAVDPTGATYSTAGISAAIDDALSSGRALVFPAGLYTLDDQILKNLTEGQGLTLRADGDVTIDVSDVDVSALSDNAAIHVQGPALTGANTTVASDIAKGDRDVTMTDASSFSVGEWHRITSTEYFFGKSGAGGFTPKTKGEYNQVRSIAGNVVTYDRPFADSYTVSGETVTVRTIEFAGPIKVEGITWEGPGGGSGHTSSPPDDPWAFEIAECIDVEVAGNRFRNLSRIGGAVRDSMRVKVAGNDFLGRDLTDPSNAGASQSEWFTGFTIANCQDWSYQNNTAAFCRHPFDFDSLSTTANVVCRNGALLNNIVSNCLDCGGHMADKVIWVGNVITDCSGNGITARCKNPTIGVNQIDQVVNNAIRVGAGEPQSYSEDANAGVVVIDGVRARDVGNHFLEMNVDADVIYVGDSVGLDLGGESALFIGGKNTGRLIMKGGLYVRAGSASGNGLHVLNETGGLRESLDYADIDGVTFDGWGRSVYMAGTGDPATPQGPTRINVRSFGASLTHVMLGNATSTEDPNSDAGWLGGLVEIAGTYDDTPGPALTDLFSINDHRLANSHVFAPGIVLEGIQTAGVASFESTATGGTGQTLLQGHRVINSDIDASESAEWYCVTPGTFGTLNGGSTTGDISSGTNTLVVNSTTGIGPGVYLTITGAGAGGADLETRVTAISGTTITLADNAGTTVDDAAVAYTAPVMKAGAAIAA